MIYRYHYKPSLKVSLHFAQAFRAMNAFRNYTHRWLSPVDRAPMIAPWNMLPPCAPSNNASVKAGLKMVAMKSLS